MKSWTLEFGHRDRCGDETAEGWRSGFPRRGEKANTSTGKKIDTNVDPAKLDLHATTAE